MGEQGVTDAADTVFRFILEVLRWPIDHLIIAGRSLGAAAAIHLASKNKVGGVILISPFLSVRELCRDTIGYPASFLTERFPNQDRVPLICSPCLFVHGMLDTLVPFRHGETLFDLCRSRKSLVAPDMTHNDNLLNEAHWFLEPVSSFFALDGIEGVKPQVPRWAFDKRLSFHFLRLRSQLENSAMNPWRACAECVNLTDPQSEVKTVYRGTAVDILVENIFHESCGEEEDGYGSSQVDESFRDAICRPSIVQESTRNRPKNAYPKSYRSCRPSLFDGRSLAHDVPPHRGDVSPVGQEVSHEGRDSKTHG